MSGGADRTARPPWTRNLLVWAALMALLLLSFGLAYLPLGRVGTVLGIGIAFVKTALVVTLYMELARANALIRLSAAAGAFFALVLFLLTFSDVWSRP